MVLKELLRMNSLWLIDCWEKLLKGVRGEKKRPGEFRKLQNHIGRKGDDVKKAIFVPPSVLDMAELLDDFEKFINSDLNFRI